MWPIRIRHPSLYLFYCPDFPIRLPSTCHIRVLFKFILFYLGFAVRLLTLGDIRLPHTAAPHLGQLYIYLFYCLDFAVRLPHTWHSVYTCSTALTLPSSWHPTLSRLISKFVLCYCHDVADQDPY